MVDTQNEISYKPLDIGLDTTELNTQSYGYMVVSILERIIQELEDIASSKFDSKHKLLAYRWSYEAKDLSLLFRDSLLSLLKMEQYHADGIKSEEQVKKFKEELSQTLNPAIESVISSHKKYYHEDGVINPGWIHETNPISFVTNQIQEIHDQSKIIYRSRNKLYQVRNTFEDYRNSYYSYMKERSDRSQELYDLVTNFLSIAQDLSDPIIKSDALKLISRLEIKTNRIEALKSLSPYQFIVLEDTSKLKLAIDTDGGRLVTKTIDILSEISGWNSFNLVSPLKVVDAKLKAYSKRIQISLFQLLNRIKARLEGNDKVEIEKNEVIQVAQKLISEHDNDIRKSCDEKLKEIQSMLEECINPSQLFSREYNFLPSSSVNQLSNFTEKTALERRYSWPRIKSWMYEKTSLLFSKYSINEQLTAAGYVNNILGFDPESDANTLFLKSGFLGSSFTVDRPDLMLQIDQHFKLWQKGFGGGLLLEGGHLSGKSTILEMIPLVYPDMSSHHVVPGQKIDIRGHKKIMSNDLMDTLNFITKYKGAEHCIVTIDDLNYYANNPADAFDLFEALSALILKNSRQVYFVVSMHTFLKVKLCRYFDFESIFSETISTDYMHAELIEQAVTTRAHAVVNNEEINEESEMLTSSVRKITKQADNNIGRAMQLWCMTNNGNYSSDSMNNHFKALIKKHKNLLLMLVMHGHLNEPKLRSLLNEIDRSFFKSEIKTLIQLQILERPGEGLICINPYLLTFIESILD